MIQSAETTSTQDATANRTASAAEHPDILGARYDLSRLLLSHPRTLFGDLRRPLVAGRLLPVLIHHLLTPLIELTVTLLKPRALTHPRQQQQEHDHDDNDDYDHHD